jgi:hypothetical protein
MKRIVSIAAAVAAALTSGCGLTASPADNITFTAPKDWSSSPGIAGFAQFWRSGRKGEALILFRSPKPITASDVLQSANVHDVQIQSRKDITICDGQEAQQILIRAKDDAKDDPHVVDATTVMSTTGGVTYFAVYVHRIEMPANADAAAAVRELCPKK